ncbi:uncharacterized protein LOC114545159 [Dendronephthya gigantea]|uniref:uncharacterized protein LOC114518471 n=1 Tax=Dendronephthya gigantea TaxID=151771 RepID=UPI00106B577E|nr:uncharacterized protein LOC114518471 [Dendronephthya gigantea]XP_028419112.1 uncharacterized protein LOC114544787 [Dendronephthya gigantea]XP_028419113.1 uncharacterized protein LOC114544787 [Dendronephthya gigantea]XP_028419114.1 uncharacterized protein LOC114544787 [Dendronephthya gigantea]XP_028419302.1 uncharacterized protein LOC114545159 [Dendronephthya gigantea]
MESLAHIKRDNQTYYCFIDVCEKIFTDTPKSTVRNWLKSLNISTTPCATLEERIHFRRRNASLGATFSLIRDEDLTRLMAYRSEGARKRARLSHSSSATILDAADVASPSLATTDNPIVSYNLSVESDSDEQEPPVEKKFKDETTSPKRNTYTIALDSAPERLKNEVKDLRHFYLKALNHHRAGPPFSKTTVDKMVERAMSFMYFCLNVKNIAMLTLDLFNNIELYTSYVEYLKGTRNLKPSTIVAHLIIGINVLKFNLANFQPNSPDSENASRTISALQSFQRHFQHESSMISKLHKEGFTSKATQQFYFAHVLETLRNIRDKYLETHGLEKSRHLHDFVLLATYLRAIPGRSKELRTMKLHIEADCGTFDFTSVDGGNFIVFQEGNSVVIVQFDFKTSKSIGPTRIDVSDDEDLVYYLQLYTKARPSLLLGKSHDFFFLNKRGAPFDSSSSIARYIGDIFMREVSIRASTNALRHAIITYFSTLDDSKDINVRKSLALLMKHSVRYQESTYNDLTHHEKTQKGREVIREKIASNIFGEADFIALPDESDCQNDSGDELLPAVGDIVALLDPVSTKNHISFFIAKVARFTQNKQQAHLISMELLPDSTNLYRLKPGRTWKESVKALVFPIDIVYNATSKAYELRTLSDDIFDIVHGTSKK